MKTYLVVRAVKGSLQVKKDGKTGIVNEGGCASASTEDSAICEVKILDNGSACEFHLLESIATPACPAAGSKSWVLKASRLKGKLSGLKMRSKPSLRKLQGGVPAGAGKEKKATAPRSKMDVSILTGKLVCLLRA